MFNKKIIITIITLLVVIILTIILLSIYKEKASLNITSNPKSIDIYINNIKYETPVTINNIVEKEITVYGSKEGYQLYSKKIEIKQGKSQSLMITMENIGEEPKEGAPINEITNKYAKLVNDTDHYAIKTSSNEGFDLDITLYAILNAGINGPSIEEQEKNYSDELRTYKQEALDWIVSQGINPKEIKIYWIPTEAKDL